MKFSKKHPGLAWFAESFGTVEIGKIYEADSLIRLIDEGGMRWEDDGTLSIDEAMDAAEAFINQEFPDEA